MGARREEWHADAQGSSVGRNASLQDHGVDMRGKSDGSKYESRNERNYGTEERSNKVKHDRTYEGKYESRDGRRDKFERRADEGKYDSRDGRKDKFERTDEGKYESREGRKGEQRYEKWEEGSREEPTGKRADSDVGTRTRKGHLHEGEQQYVHRSMHSELRRDVDPVESCEQRKASSKEKTARSSARDTSAPDPSTKHDKGETSQEQQGGQTRALDDERSRQWKERNKGHKANHNRRDLADRKRNKGMY